MTIDYIASALVPRLHTTYKSAAQWLTQNPDEAAGIIATKSTPEVEKAIASLIKSNESVGMNVVPASEIRKEIEAVYRAGVEVGYFADQPSSDTISDAPLP